jgi:pSer/pThr/pTyr-binding forkhead associated (FHA) protein
MVGRDPACDLILADKTVSGQHARLSYQMTQWWVEDLQSTNGSRLNQQAVSSPVVLTSGDELCFGQLVFQVQIAIPDSGQPEQPTG